MALLFPSSFSALSSPSSSTSGLAARPLKFFRLCHKSISLHPTKTYPGSKIQPPFILHNRGPLITKASSDVGGTGSTDLGGPPPPPGGKEESTPFEKLPLESKLQQKEDQKMKMKLAKKIRLRRKRLVRKRHLRKKGRWPPSKLKKNKNV